MNRAHFAATIGMIVLILLGALRSHLATRSDGFTYDEPWHITAGVSYVRTGDFHLGPEHPPLVKLWLGAWLSGEVFQLPPFRALGGNIDERSFLEDAVYLKNDPDRIQRRVRLAMLGFHSLALLAFALAAWRVLGKTTALAALALLLIDPTVAAHLPVAMTDLPLALLSSTAMLLAVAAFRSWRKLDLTLAALALGLALGAKHSGLITALAVGSFGLVMATLRAREDCPLTRRRRLAMMAAVVLGAFVVLWSLYGFRFNESGAGRDLFNRPMAEKINELKSPLHRGALHWLARCHALPRAYLSGMADIIRLGVEGGHNDHLFLFGKIYDRTPWYFFPGALLVKLPLGLIVLATVGAALLLRRRVSPALVAPMSAVVGLAGVFLLFMARSNSGYAGVRHAMAVIPPLAMLAALTIKTALDRKSRALGVFAVLAIIGASASALPVARPWEYYNELVGGPANAYRYFNDEGVDLGQRTMDIVRYYDQRLRAAGEVPYDDYSMSKEYWRPRGMTTRSWEDEEFDVDVITGTVFINATSLAPRRVFDYDVFRQAQPAERFGNLFVYRGQFHLPWLKAFKRFWKAMGLIYAAEPDLKTAERLLAEVVESYPKACAAALELGNLLAKRGARDEAIRVYEIAKANSPPNHEIIVLLERQIERLRREPPEPLQPVRNPWLE